MYVSDLLDLLNYIIYGNLVLYYTTEDEFLYSVGDVLFPAFAPTKTIRFDILNNRFFQLAKVSFGRFRFDVQNYQRFLATLFTLGFSCLLALGCEFLLHYVSRWMINLANNERKLLFLKDLLSKYYRLLFLNQLLYTAIYFKICLKIFLNAIFQSQYHLKK